MLFRLLLVALPFISSVFGKGAFRAECHNQDDCCRCWDTCLVNCYYDTSSSTQHRCLHHSPDSTAQPDCGHDSCPC
ncbi:hypothetical protein EJ03DRAFT_330887 [Teratosphaeria nubilosa]|uniref:Uncharacterized protein n=1 Tax=Teratosphaeria nubilosa TaxID=161662 RepID=A0A6G1KXV5_9PEZI|nr:hypothetical protein EJ03DRAFT_330887 [Teratosphaeria nubilosa]